MVITDTLMGPRAVGGKLVGVQAARGVAALMVVIYHTTRSLSLPQYLGHIPFANAFGFGHAGVDFFFVLSGFIITHAHLADVGRTTRLHRYLWRRFTRIFPIYWFVTGIEIVRALLSPDAAGRLAPSHVWHSLLLLPESAEPLVNVAWTLRSEMLFYLVFALPIIDRRFVRPLIIGSLLLILIGVVTAPTDPWLGLLVSPFNIEFLMGVGAANLLAHRQIPRPTTFVTAGALCFLGIGALEVFGLVPLNGLMGRMLYGSASAAILAGLVGVEKRGGLRLGLAGLMLGDASYCLYLIHLTVVPLSVRLFAQSGLLGILPVWTVVVLLVAGSSVIAVGLHMGVELPLMRFVRARTPRACR